MIKNIVQKKNEINIERFQSQKNALKFTETLFNSYHINFLTRETTVELESSLLKQFFIVLICILIKTTPLLTYYQIHSNKTTLMLRRHMYIVHSFCFR